VALRHWRFVACRGAREEADVIAARGGAGATGDSRRRKERPGLDQLQPCLLVAVSLLLDED
jgi:hypothetical protein